jgi:hypothetical protein
VPDPFISTQDIVDYLGRGGTADPGMVMAADAACDMVRTLTGRTVNQVMGAAVVLDGTGTDALHLPELPVSAAGTVVVNGGTITDYMLNGNGILFRGTAGIDPRPVWPMGRQNVRVTYDHGWPDADIPRDLRRLALSLASRMVLQGEAKSETVGDVSITWAGAAHDLTTTEKLIVDRYRQIRSF